MDGVGRILFALVYWQNLDRIVVKSKRGTYAALSSWIKVKNLAYTGAHDRYELMG
jgi:hypothetical protein